jgi:glycosyltransferase involved in cell wall biosynthesis
MRRPERSDQRERVRLLSFLTNFIAGGTEQHVATLTKRLDPDVFEQHVACLTGQGDFLAEFAARGIPLTEYPIAHLYGLSTVRQQLRFARHLRSRRIQIVHTYGFYAHVFAIPAARLAGTPAIIASIRDSGDLWTRAQLRVQRGACLLAHRVLTNADAVKQRLVADGYRAAKIDVIRSGVTPSTDDRRPPGSTLRDELGLAADTPLVAMVSRLNRARGIDFKGVGDFLAAAALVAKRRPDVRFVILGDGPCRAEFECDARQRGLADRVVFAGLRMDVQRLLAEVTLSVLPSLSEGLPNALLESMAAGVPTVATNVGGNPEVVADGVTGLLVPPRDGEALAAAMCVLLERPELARRFGEAARQRASACFSIERMVHETEALYLHLLRSRAPAAAVSLSEAN